MKRALLLVVFVFLFCGVKQVCAATIVSTFDIDTDGWTASGASVAHEASGGNPGGYLSVTDTADDTAAAIFPAKFLGNLLGFDSGLLTYDFIVVEPRIPLDSVGSGFGRIQMNGPTTNATFDYGLNPPVPSIDSWKIYFVPMSAAAWNTTQENWELLLSDVTHIDVIVQAGTTVGMDNVRLASAAVPEPSSLLMLGFGLFGLAGRTRNFRKRYRTQ